MSDIDRRILKTINEQKGQITALTCLINGLFHSLPRDFCAKALREFDTETELARAMFAQTNANDVVKASFEAHVKALNDLRQDQPNQPPSQPIKH